MPYLLGLGAPPPGDQPVRAGATYRFTFSVPPAELAREPGLLAGGALLRAALERAINPDLAHVDSQARILRADWEDRRDTTGDFVLTVEFTVAWKTRPPAPGTERWLRVGEFWDSVRQVVPGAALRTVEVVAQATTAMASAAVSGALSGIGPGLVLVLGLWWFFGRAQG